VPESPANEWERVYQESLDREEEHARSQPGYETADALLNFRIFTSFASFLAALGVLLVAWLGSLSSGWKAAILAAAGTLVLGAIVMLVMHLRVQRKQQRAEFEERPTIPSGTTNRLPE